MGKIIWLASYPKLGNTWLRAVLTNYLRNADQPVDINDLEGGPVAGARELFDEQVGLESSDLTPEETDAYRPQVYEGLLDSPVDPFFLKIHDACLQLPGGEWLVSAPATRGAVYILRNPLDVAVSFAHHNGVPIEKMITFMADPTYAIGSGRQEMDMQMRQRLLTWSGHACSWLDQTVFPVHLMRYEDMQTDPQTVFEAAFRFMGFPDEPERLARALRFSDFRALQTQEQEHGFRERSSRSESPFFRRGEAGGWRATMTEAQAAEVVQTQAEVMRRFGYLSDTGELLC